jgi:hypothetical protein
MDLAMATKFKASITGSWVGCQVRVNGIAGLFRLSADRGSSIGFVLNFDVRDFHKPFTRLRISFTVALSKVASCLCMPTWKNLM